MLNPDDAFAEAVEAAVAEVERDTAAELIVVVAPRSETYNDLAVAGGAIVAWAVLVGLLISPFHFSLWAAALEAPLLGAAAGYWLSRSPRLLRRLASAKRQHAAARTRAAAMFHQEAVYCTRARTGVLVFVSLLESHVEVVTDVGVSAVLSEGDLHRVRWGGATPTAGPRSTDQFVAGLRMLGALLAGHLPSSHDNPDEMSNRPRVLA